MLENLIIESLHMIEVYLYIKRRGSQWGTLSLLKLRFNQFNLREISDKKNYFVMLNVLTGKNEFYEDANW